MITVIATAFFAFLVLITAGAWALWLVGAVFAVIKGLRGDSI